MESALSCPYLLLENSNGKSEVRLGEGDFWKLGRNSKCLIEIKDEAISRNHAMIQLADEQYFFIDLGSQNGSFVNERRVSTPVALKNGDCISVGRTRIIFRNPHLPAANRPPSLTDYGSTQQIFAQQLVTVLVVDIRDYTVLTHQIDQHVLCQVIGTWFSDAERIMKKFGSTVQKYIGDAVMALWVHKEPEDEQTDILQILSALAEFIGATNQLSERFGLTGKLRVGAGLSTGVAAVGSPGKADLTALGDSVNAAFRLEKATKDLATDVVLGQVSFDSLRSLPKSAEYFQTHEVKLKGYEGLVKTWAISFPQLAGFLRHLGRTDAPLQVPGR
jgi:adenylate cyclase